MDNLKKSHHRLVPEPMPAFFGAGATGAGFQSAAAAVLPAAGCSPNSRTQLQDWNQLGRYHQDDLRLEEAPAVAGRVVFLGDSITDGWDLAKYFPGKPYVNRGISGQTTMQMLVRMHPDVIHLRPAAFILLAGTNDIAQQYGSRDAGDGGRQYSRHVRAGREPQHQDYSLLAHSRQRLRQGGNRPSAGRLRIL